MRIATLVGSGLAALAFVNTAYAVEPSACADTTDCDGDLIPDVDDLCPFVSGTAANQDKNQTTLAAHNTKGVPGVHDDCIAGTGANINIHALGTIGHGVYIDDQSSVNVNYGAHLGNFAYVGGDDAGLTLAPSSIISDAPNASRGTRLHSGVVGRAAEVGYDPNNSTSLLGKVTAGNDLTMARATSIGYGATLGDNVTLGFGASIGPNAIIGNNVNLVTGAEVGWGAYVGSGSEVGRESVVSNYAAVGPNTDIAPNVIIDTYAQVGAHFDTNGNPVDDVSGGSIKLRRGARVGSHAFIGQNVTVGRDSQIGEFAHVANGTTGVVLRNSTIIAAGVDFRENVDAGGVANAYTRGTAIRCFSDGAGGTYQSAQTTIPTGPPAHSVITCGAVPPEPDGTFFSAAGGVVCNDSADANHVGICMRRPSNGTGLSYDQVGSNGSPASCTNNIYCPGDGEVDTAFAGLEIVSYCLDEITNVGGAPASDGLCDPVQLDGGGNPVAAQAIVITAPDTIGVSPYSYNYDDTTASLGHCPGDTQTSSDVDGVVTTGTAPNFTCTVTVRAESGPILQAGPIFVLSPPSN